MASKRAEIEEIINHDMSKRDLPTEALETDKKQPQKDPMVIFSIRLPESQKATLQAHFKQDLGLDLAPGIRMLITQYMREKRI